MNNDKDNDVLEKMEIVESQSEMASKILSTKKSPMVSPEITEKSIQELVDDIATGNLRVSRRYQRTFSKDRKWSSALIESTVNGYTTAFDNMYVHARCDDYDDLMDGLHRLSTYIWFLKGCEYPVGHPKHGTKYRDYLKLQPNTVFILKDGTQIDVGGMNWPQIKKHKEFQGELIKHIENKILHQKYKVVRFRKLTEAEVYTRFRQIADRFPFTDQQWRNSYASDCAEYIKTLTIKDYPFDENNSDCKFHPVFELENNRPKYFSSKLNLKREKIQSWALETAYILEEWNTDEFDCGGEMLDRINLKYDEPGSFKKKHSKLEKYLSFLERVATNDRTLTTKNPILFASDTTKNIIGGSRLSVFVTVMWDKILNNLKFEKDGVVWKYEITTDTSSSKTITNCPSLRFYNFILSIYSERSMVTDKNPGIGVLNETAFRNAVRKGTLSKKEWVLPVMNEVSPYLDNLHQFSELDLSKIGLRRVDSKRNYDNDQKANAWRDCVPTTEDGKSISFMNLDADHTTPHSLGGSTNDPPILVPPSINRSKGNKMGKEI